MIRPPPPPDPDFQLPLSGSHINMRSDEAELQPFNSLSRDHRLSTGRRPPLPSVVPLSTPSLGITTKIAKRHDALRPDFQLPLSGSHGSVLRAITIDESEPTFQLPLSGSPNPIPGFSGSPRLPAAAPLRTSVFSGHYLKI